MNGKFEERLLTELEDKEYRDAFVEGHIRTDAAYQIRALRTSRHWSQEELANRGDTTQSVIARLENPDYGKFSLTTLLKLASGFDVALLVQFVSFSELLDRTRDLSPEGLNAPSYADDPVLHRKGHVTTTDDSAQYRRDIQGSRVTFANPDAITIHGVPPTNLDVRASNIVHVARTTADTETVQ